MKTEITELKHCKKIKIEKNNKSPNYGITITQNNGRNQPVGGYSIEELPEVIDEIYRTDEKSISDMKFVNDLRNRNKKSEGKIIGGLTDEEYDKILDILGAQTCMKQPAPTQ